MTQPPRARTFVEMQFAASLEACPHCLSRERGRYDLVGHGMYWSLVGTCPSCRRPRSFSWDTEGNPLDGAHGVRHLGDARPSAIIRPGQFVEELDRLLPVIVLDPRRLTPADWYASRNALNRALTCLIELQKFIPADVNDIPESSLTPIEREDQIARSERYARDWLADMEAHLFDVLAAYEADAARIDALERVREPAGAIDDASLRAHAAWLHSGGAAGRRLEVVSRDAPAARLAAANLTAAHLTDVTLDGVILEGALLVDAELSDVRAQSAHMTAVRLDRARVERGSFAHSTLALARFDGAVFTGTDLRKTRLDRSTWTGARVHAAIFDEAIVGNAVLDDAHFSQCSFLRTDLRRVSTVVPATTRAVFEDCDLRGSRWDGRDVTGAQFIRCKVAGVRGVPVGLDTATFLDPDLSPDGDGDIGTADDVRAVWR